jgi:hypothetical protein
VQKIKRPQGRVTPLTSEELREKGSESKHFCASVSGNYHKFSGVKNPYLRSFLSAFIAAAYKTIFSTSDVPMSPLIRPASGDLHILNPNFSLFLKTTTADLVSLCV